MTTQDLSVRYVGDATGLKKTLAEIDAAHSGLASKLKSVGTSLSSAGRTMTTHFTLPIVAGFAVAINEATEFAQVQAQTAAALKSTGGAAGVTAQHVVDLSTKIGALSAQDGELVQAGENVLLTFTNIRNEAGKGNNVFDQASVAAANLAARMGTDLKGAMVLVGKAVNDPIKGLSALTRVGVTFTEQQKAQITKLVESGHAMEAQKVILAELNKEFGGSAKAAGDAASPFTKLKLAFLDMAQSLGTVLLPMVKSAGDFLTGLAQKFQGLSPEVQKTIVVIGLIVAAVGPVVLIIGKLVSGIGVLVSAFGAAATAVQFVFGLLLANPFVALAAAIIAISVFVATHFREIKEFILAAWNKIKEFTRAVWEAIPGPIKAVLNVIIGVIKAAFGIIKSVFQIEWNIIKTVVEVAWDAIKLLIIHPLQFIWGKIKDFFQLIKPAWNAFWDVISSVAGGAWDVIVGAATVAMNIIKGILNGVIMAINAVIRGFNLLPGHDDVPTIPHLAGGTSNFRGGLALVGERGPELVGLPRGSSVMPADRTRAAFAGGGGGGITLNVNVGTLVGSNGMRELSETIRRELILLGRRNGGSAGIP